MEDVWPNKKEDYKLEDIIGHGATATVHSALCLPRQEKCAIKRIGLEKGDVTIDMFEKEIQAMNQCKHENVMNYFTSFVVKDELWVVMRLYNRGSMHNILKKRIETQDTKNGVLDEATIATVLREILKGLEYLHKNGQIHRDIKAGNILLDEDGSVVLADFGVSAWVAIGKGCSRDAMRRTFVGTPCWMAPEVMDSSDGYDVKADIWSLGITAIELAVGMPPFYEMPPMKVLMTVLQNEAPTLEVCAKEKNQYKAYSKVFRRFISDCLQKSAQSRPSAKQLLKHDFFKKAKDKAHMRKLFLEEVIVVHPPRVKRPSGSSGRLHKNDQGEWVFSDDEDDDEDPMEPIVEDAPNQNGQDGELSNGMKNTAESSTDAKAVVGKSTPEIEGASEADGPHPVEKLSPDDKGAEASEKPATESPDDSVTEKLPEEMKNLSMAGDAATTDGEVFHLVLRIRDAERKLQDIKFDFTTGQDHYNNLAFDLVDAKLLDPKDVIVVASSIEKIVKRQVPSNSIIFPLASGIAPDEVANDKNLYGFALLSIADAPATTNQSGGESGSGGRKEAAVGGSAQALGQTELQASQQSAVRNQGGFVVSSVVRASQSRYKVDPRTEECSSPMKQHPSVETHDKTSTSTADEQSATKENAAAAINSSKTREQPLTRIHQGAVAFMLRESLQKYIIADQSSESTVKLPASVQGHPEDSSISAMESVPAFDWRSKTKWQPSMGIRSKIWRSTGNSLGSSVRSDRKSDALMTAAKTRKQPWMGIRVRSSRCAEGLCTSQSKGPSDSFSRSVSSEGQSSATGELPTVGIQHRTVTSKIVAPLHIYTQADQSSVAMVHCRAARYSPYIKYKPCFRRILAKAAKFFSVVQCVPPKDADCSSLERVSASGHRLRLKLQLLKGVQSRNPKPIVQSLGNAVKGTQSYSAGFSVKTTEQRPVLRNSAATSGLSATASGNGDWFAEDNEEIPMRLRVPEPGGSKYTDMQFKIYRGEPCFHQVVEMAERGLLHAKDLERVTAMLVDMVEDYPFRKSVSFKLYSREECEGHLFLDFPQSRETLV